MINIYFFLYFYSSLYVIRSIFIFIFFLVGLTLNRRFLFLEKELRINQPLSCVYENCPSE